MNYERGQRQPLNKYEKYILHELSQGLTKDELLIRIQALKQDPKNNIFPDFFGHSMFDSLINGLLGRGLIREVFITTEQGKKELKDAQRIKTIPRLSVQPVPRPVERPRIDPPKPAPQVRPIQEARIQEKPKKARLGLEDLAKVRGQFRPE